jgi:DEAD/DEAH box helicase domain-containing protein
VDACDVIGAVAGDPLLGERVVHVERIPAREAVHAAPSEPLDPRVRDLLAGRGIAALFSHQARALDLVRGGTHVAVATGTASGKSLCYQIPILEAAVAGRPATALLLFPTKALAHDQLRSLRSWLLPELEADAYDGDTPAEDRARVRRRARVLLTNPDMLHVGILPFHQRWASFLRNLEVVVVDELHTLRGIFGSHVAALLRRLRRLCDHYGASPVFVFTSATIGNPGDLAERLLGVPVETVDEDGSPRGERCFAVWQRPLLDPESGARASANFETARVVAELAKAGLHTLAFTRSRKGAELVAQQVRDVLSGQGEVALAERVAAYRGGYLAEERRDLERRLVGGELLAVATTNALELGIDVGNLDAVALNGFPGTLASMWQQAGRAGRTGGRAGAVLVAGDDQLDQWYATHPDELFSRSPEPAVVNPDNPYVLTPHVGCAAFELPLTDADAAYFGDGLDGAASDLVRDNLLRPRDGRLFWSDRRPPAGRVSLRTGGSVEYLLLESGSNRLIGTVDGSRAFQVAHEGAVYLHQGRQFRVARLDLRAHTAHLEATDDEEYTQTREAIDLTVSAVETTRTIGSATAHLGGVAVTTTVTGYQRKEVATGEVIEIVDLDLPALHLVTRACWYTVGPEILEAAGVEPVRMLGALHAAEHAMIGMLPLFTICDRSDVGGLSIALHPDTGLPSIFVYDGYQGGAGIAELAFASAERHLGATLAVVRGCPCDAGCPSCVQSPKCGNWNEYLDKDGAVALLEAVVTP